MVRLGRAVGYALLGLVDALAPAALLGFTAWSVVPYGIDGATAVTVGLGVAAVTFLVGAVLGTIAAARERGPFPITRWLKRVWERTLYLWP